MSTFKDYLKKQNIELSPRRYFIDAMSAMAQGLFASLLIGTIIKTLGQQLNVKTLVDVGQFAFDMCGPAIAVAIGYALHASPLVLFSLVAVGFAGDNYSLVEVEGTLRNLGGPLAVYIIAIVACECGKLVSKRTKVDILVTPAVTTLVGVLLAKLIAPAIGAGAYSVGEFIKQTTEPCPFRLPQFVLGLN